MAHTIGILVFDGAEELDFVGPWEVFTASAMLRERAGEQPDHVLLIAETLDPVRCAKGLRVLPDATVADHPRLDVVLVPGGEGKQRAAEDPTLLGWLAGAGTTAAMGGQRVYRLVTAAHGGSCRQKAVGNWVGHDRSIFGYSRRP